ncbi:MAG: OmpA family protein [Brumimicrobium sp.]|nr:OmpA family protein [Brumimicrobium sp.]MCO5267811.1 DUF5723 family protein [Brumimicrobium sp.]
MRRKILLYLLGINSLLFITTKKVNAQNYLGVINSNYAGIMGADLQPASIVDSRFIVDVNLFSFSFEAFQNAKYFDPSALPKRNWPYSLRKDTKWMDDKNLYEKYFHNYQDYNSPLAKPAGAYVNFQLDILNFMFHINRKIALGFSSKLRVINNIDNVHPKVLKLAEEELDYEQLWHTDINGSLLSQNALAWMEYGINYAQVVMDKDEHFLKIGGRLKFNQGIFSSYINAGDLSFNLHDKKLAADIKGRASFGYSDNFTKFVGGDDDDGFSLNNFFKMTSKIGVGGDLGVVYEWRPKWKDYKYDMDGKINLWRRDRNAYELRVGVSLLDLGGMRFTKADKSRDFTVDAKNVDLKIFDGTNDLKKFGEVIDSLIANDPQWKASEDTAQTYYMHTPTTLSFQVDYHIWNDFYVNATAFINVNNKKNPHNVRNATRFSITPSYDFRWFGIGIPISYGPYSKFMFGLGLRLGPLTIGVPDFRTLIPFGKVNGAGIYAGLRVPIPYGHPSDRDGDNVSDKKDVCPDVPGVWDFLGCPDTDGDGIPDSEDDCPMTPGLKEFNGCPDTDGDGIPDKNDDCPDVAGLPQFNGCPDTDGDGIPDKDDKCPEEAGLAEFNGCPDTDGDGIPDYEDACPDVPGPKEYDGCPDTDGDGILDFLDECPHEPGPKENNGCPWKDTDGDGVLDKDDKCPNIPGPKENDGCPYTDTDGDGVPDKDDKCPETPGPKENDGCPIIEKEVEEVLQTAFDNLEFETGKAIIRPSSFPSLLDLAEVLKKKEEWNLQISGHTDNVGNSQSNMVLSKKRAEAVRDFLSAQGIDMKRFNVLYFGDTQPIDSNDTPEGRQRNRRVEMTIIFK